MNGQTETGLWAERRSTRSFAGKGGLFLDRDGVVNVEYGYVGRPEDVDLIEPTAELIRMANAAGVAVVVVTNQSGIGRGYFGWDGFVATMNAIHEGLHAHGATIDMVYACAYHGAAQGAYRIDNHPMRKPRPGMILSGLRDLDLEKRSSLIVGDSWRDMEAGQGGHLAGGAFVGTGKTSDLPGFPVSTYALAEAGAHLIADFAAFLEDSPSPWTRDS